MLGVGVAEIVQVVCVIVLERKSVLHVLHVRYVLASKILQLVSICYHMGVVRPVIMYLPSQSQHYFMLINHEQTTFECNLSTLRVIVRYCTKQRYFYVKGTEKYSAKEASKIDKTN